MPHDTQACLMKKRWWWLWKCYLTPLMHCLRLLVYLSVEHLILCSVQAAAEKTYFPCTPGQFHHPTCQMQTGTPGGQTLANVRWQKQTEKSLSVWSMAFSLEPLCQCCKPQRGGLCFFMKKGPLCNALSLFPILPCLIFLFVSGELLNKASVSVCVCVWI